MPVVAPFKLSDTTRTELAEALAPLSDEQKKKAFDAMGALAAEVELHVRKAALEELRQGWSNALWTMFLVDPKTKLV